jgi:hypothetical protein
MRVRAIAFVLGALAPALSATAQDAAVAFDPATMREVSIYQAWGSEDADVPLEYGPVFRKTMSIGAARAFAERFVHVYPNAMVELCPFQTQTQYLWSIPVTWKERMKRCERHGILLP